MQTEKVPKGPTDRLLLPPVSLEFEITQVRRDHCRIHVRGRSGNHCFVHRQVLAFYDHFGEIPVIVGSSMLNWTLWLVQFEAQRREADPAGRRQLHFQFPAWPSPESLAPPPEDIGF